MERVTAEPTTLPPAGSRDDEDPRPQRSVADPRGGTRRRVVTGLLILAVGVLAVLGLGIGANNGQAAFGLSSAADPVQIPVLRLPGGGTAMVLGALIVALGLWQLARGFSRSAMRWVVAAVTLLFVLAFLCWAATGQPGTPVDLLGTLQLSVFAATPLILGALAGIVCERSGVINVAIEGQLLAGAFAGALAASVASLWVGVVAAALAGALIGALLAVFAIRFLVNQVVLGVVINLLMLGLTGYLYRALMQEDSQTYNSPATLPPLRIPGLADIPVLGPLLFDANILVYLMYALIVVVDVGLFRTRWGLRTRAVGEHPRAADTVGIDVRRVRYRNVLLGGLIAGLGGAFLTIGAVGGFSANISSGKGFIALAAVIFGRWSPRGAVAAALLFGFTNELQVLLSVIGTPVQIPSSFLAMLPYVATLFAVAGLVGRVRAPAADGVPYTKE
jgi:general nucleoside transport system permease protein